MQQFARRQPQDGPNPEPGAPVANETVAQLLDQITRLQSQVAAFGDDLAQVKAENAKLRSHLAGMIADQVSPQAPEPPAPAPIAPAAAPENSESVDEELLVEWVRGSGLGATTSDALRTAEDAPTVTNSEPAIEETPNAPLSDDEIQRLLAEAAGEPAPATTPEEAPAEEPYLHLDETPAEPEWPISIGFEVSKEALAKVPAHLAIGALAIPVRIEGNKLVCKAAAPFDRVSLDMIADASACEVLAEPAPIEQIVTALRAAYKDDGYDHERASVWEVAEPPKKRRGLAKLFRRAA